MAFLRAYSMRNPGVLPGRGLAKGDPFIGALIGAAAPLVKRGVGKILSKATGGKLIGAGGGKAILTKAAKGAAGFGGAVAATKFASGLPSFGFGGGGRKRYKRMNAGNAKALRRAFRRIDAFSKLAAKAGYVRRKPFGRRAK